MDSKLMGSLKSHFPQVGFHQKLFKTHIPSSMAMVSAPNVIICGLRGGPRKPMWRSRVLSTEAIQVVQCLKLAKSTPTRLEVIFSDRLTRLLKADLLDTLAELQRQNELDLALKVFKFVRKEVWYKPDISLYCDMIRLLAKNKLIEMAEELFGEIKEVGLEPNTRAFTEIIGAYLQLGMIEKAMEMYGLMKASGCTPDKLTFTILIRNLEKVGEEDKVSAIKKDCVEYMDSPKKFIKEVERKHPKRRTLSLV